MSEEVNKRIVEMRLDNQQFETAGKKTLNTLDEMDRKLQFKDGEKGFAKVQKEADKLDFGELIAAVDRVNARFSTMNLLGMTALVELEKQALRTGKRMIKSLTLDPVLSGMSEYETQIKSVQTILANTAKEGASIGKVNAALDELNRYADLTIYNFTEMSRSIGTFTAAGVKLNDSVQAIKGMANLAAMSGSTSQQLNTAMYQTSQALSSGVIRLMDWNSIVNAGMGGTLFQDSLMETARVRGIAIDAMIAQDGSFRDTLSRGWLSSEIMLETLAKFTGDLSREQLRSIGYTEEQIESIEKLGQSAQDAATKVKTFSQLKETLKESLQSGWTESWELMIGDFEEAREGFSQISDLLSGIIEKSAAARNALLREGFGSGWKQLMGTGLGSQEENFAAALQSLLVDSGMLTSEAVEKAGGLGKALQTSGIRAEQLREALVLVTRELETLAALSDEQARAQGIDKSKVYTALESYREILDQVNSGTLDLVKIEKSLGRMSGREHLLSGAMNLLRGMGSVLGSIRNGFWDVIGDSGESIYRFLEGFDQLSARMRLSDSAAANLEKTTAGLFSALSIALKALNALIRGTGAVLGAAGRAANPLLEGLLALTGAVGQAIQELDEALSKAESFGEVLEILQQHFDQAAQAVRGYWSKLRQAGEGGILAGVGRKLEEFGKRAGEAGQNGAAGMGLLEMGLAALGAAVGAAGGAIAGGLNLLEGLLHQNGEDLTGLGDETAQRLNQTMSRIEDTMRKHLPTMQGLGEDLFAPLAQLDLYRVMSLADVGLLSYMIGQLAKAMGNLSTGFKDPFTSFMGTLTDTLKKGGTAIEAWKKAKNAEALLSIAKALGILIGVMAASAYGLSRIKNTEALLLSAGSVLAMLASVVAGLAVLSKLPLRNLASLATAGAAIGTLAVALAGMTMALKTVKNIMLELGEMEPEDLKATTDALAKVMASLGLVFVQIGLANALGGMKGAGQMVAAAGAVAIIAGVLRKLGELDAAAIGRGLYAIETLMARLTVTVMEVSLAGALLRKYSKSIEKNFRFSMKGLAGTGVAAAGIATAALQLSRAAKRLGEMDADKLRQGLIATAQLAGGLTVAMVLLKGTGPSLIGTAAAMLGMAAAIEAMILPVVTLANIPWETLSLGFAELSIGLGVLGGLMTLLSGQGRGWNMVALSASMGLLEGSLLTMAPAIMAFNLVDWSALGKAAVVIGGMLAALMGTAAVIGLFPHLAGGLLSLAAAFGAFGVALGTLSLASAALGVLALFAGPVCTAILNAAPDIEAALVMVVQVICSVIIQSAEPISKALVTTGLVLIVTIEEILGFLWDSASENLDGIWGEFVQWLQEHNLLEELGKWLYELPFIHQATNIITWLGKSIKTTGEDMAGLFGSGFGNLFNGIDRLTDRELGVELLQGWLGVTDEQVEAAKAKAEEDGKQVGTAYNEGTEKGLRGSKSIVEKAAEEVAEAVDETVKKTTDINSPSKVMEENGYYMTLGLAVGLTNSQAKGALFGAVEKLCRMLDERFCDWWGIHSASDTMIAHAGDMALGLHDGLTDEHATTLLQNGVDGASRTLEERFRDKMGRLKTVVGEQTDQVMDVIRAKWDPDSTIQSWMEKSLPGSWAKTYFGTEDEAETSSASSAKSSSRGTSGKTLAQQLQEKYKTLLEANQLLRETAEEEYALWAAENQSSAREDELLAKKAENAATLITIQTERVALAQKKYDEMTTRWGADKQETKEAYLELLKEKTSLAEKKAEQYVDLFEEAASRYDTDLSLLEKEYGLWTAQNEEKASNADKINRETEYLTAQLAVREKKLLDVQKQYDILAQKAGEADQRTKNAQLELLDAKKEHQELLNELAQQELELIQAELSSIQDIQAISASRMNRMQKMYEDGSLASRSQDYKTAVETYGPNSEQARRARYQGTMSAILDVASATQGLAAQMKQTVRYQKLYSEALEKAGGDRTNSQVLAAEKQLVSSQASFVDYAGALAEGFGMEETGKRLMMQLANAIQENWEPLSKSFAQAWKRAEENAPELAEGLRKAFQRTFSDEGVEIGAGVLASIVAGLQGDYGNALVSGIGVLLKAAGTETGQQMIAGVSAALQNGASAIAGITGALGQAGGAMSGLVASAGALLPEILPVLAAVTAIGLVIFGIYKLVKKFAGDKPTEQTPSGGYPTGGPSSAKPVVQMTLAPEGAVSVPYTGGPTVDSLYTRNLASGVNNAAAYQHRDAIYNDSGVREDIRALEGRIAQVGEAIENLEMVTDTGKLVGEMAPKMDKRLGDRAKRNGRGR